MTAQRSLVLLALAVLAAAFADPADGAFDRERVSPVRSW
jgi:hypothetical protein